MVTETLSLWPDLCLLRTFRILCGDHLGFVVDPAAPGQQHQEQQGQNDDGDRHKGDDEVELKAAGSGVG